MEKNFKIILIDARGHGRSDKLHEKGEYQTRTMVGDVVSVLNALGIESTHFFGYSMGGRIGLAQVFCF